MIRFLKFCESLQPLVQQLVPVYATGSYAMHSWRAQPHAGDLIFPAKCIQTYLSSDLLY